MVVDILYEHDNSELHIISEKRNHSIGITNWVNMNAASVGFDSKEDLIIFLKESIKKLENES